MSMKRTKMKNFIMIPEQLLKLNLTPRACLLYGIIYKLSSGELQETFASPKYFSNILKVETRTIKNLLNELKENNIISIREDETNHSIKYIKPLIINEIIFVEDEKTKVETPKAVKEFLESLPNKKGL